MADPLRHPWQGLLSIFNPIGTFKDKCLMMKLRRQASASDLSEYCPPSSTTLEHTLCKIGFSDEMTTRFFRPFFGGVFSDSNLETSKSIFEFVLSMFWEGANNHPGKGYGSHS